ncbi:LemA family protein, partial [Burkholderia pseudomallei]
ANFRDLQAQLEGTENRITVARNRYIRSVQAYNTTIRSFPSNLAAGATGCAAHGSDSTSSGSASTTGPGRPDIATWNAWLRYSGMRRGSSICATHFASWPNMRR